MRGEEIKSRQDELSEGMRKHWLHSGCVSAGSKSLKAHFPPLSDYRVQQLLEQSSVLCSGPFCLNGTLAAEGQQLLWKHKTLACYKDQLTFWTWNLSDAGETTKQTQKEKHRGDAMLKLHCTCIYFSNRYSHSEQFHYSKETISSLQSWMKWLTKLKSGATR